MRVCDCVRRFRVCGVSFSLSRCGLASAATVVAAVAAVVVAVAAADAATAGRFIVLFI